ncbi:Clavaminate synthase-like protein [Thozetella sp. PMI_491]|nr:Clavaminate synthase-like protein [Thozetella sp. PMI_491]
MATAVVTGTATVIGDIQDRTDTAHVYYGSGGYVASRPILTGSNSKKTFDSIPTVDVSAIFSPDLEVRKGIAKEIAKVCEEVGFFYAVNPPVSTSKMDEALEAVKTFFRMSQEELLKLHVDNSQMVKGYLPFKFKDGSSRRASYSLGRDYTNPEQHFVNVAPSGTMPVNQFPDQSMPEFRKVIYEYYHEVFLFAQKMLQIFALALGLDETDLDETFRHPLTDITMQYYPIQELNEQSSISPHVDYGGFTLLYQDDVGGLEVLNANGIWVPAPPKKHAYVVNTGSYMEVLSNGRFPATVHRAFGNPNRERFSLPFFFNPYPFATIQPHPKLLASGKKSAFEPQDVSRRTVKGITSNRLDHPFWKKVEDLGLRREDWTFDLVTRPLEEIAAMHSARKMGSQ